MADAPVDAQAAADALALHLPKAERARIWASRSAEEQTLRRLLWLRHGCPIGALYGDDGEMTCNACLIDFRVAHALEIDLRFVELGGLVLARVHLAASPNPAAKTLTSSAILFRARIKG